MVCATESSLLCLGFHPVDLSLAVSRSVFLMSPTHPLPPSAPPVKLNSTSFSVVVVQRKDLLDEESVTSRFIETRNTMIG